MRLVALCRVMFSCSCILYAGRPPHDCQAWPPGTSVSYNSSTAKRWIPAVVQSPGHLETGRSPLCDTARSTEHMQHTDAVIGRWFDFLRQPCIRPWVQHLLVVGRSERKVHALRPVESCSGSTLLAAPTLSLGREYSISLYNIPTPYLYKTEGGPV